MEKKIRVCPVCSRRCTVELSVDKGEITAVAPYRGEGFEGCCAYCVKGANGGAYRSRADRLLTPLRRVGERGEGRFEAISWEEAIEEISRRLLKLRE